MPVSASGVMLGAAIAPQGEDSIRPPARNTPRLATSVWQVAQPAARRM